jgi:glycosyltransferase involved in cell wall biosynthesis
VSHRFSGNGDFQDSKSEVLHRVLRLFKGRHSPCGPDDVHLDIGAPSRAHADAMRKAIGGVYVGIGLQAADQAPVAGDGCEFHHIGPNELFAERLDQIVGGRNVASITLLEQIERLANIEAVLEALGDLAHSKRAFVAISASNSVNLDAGAEVVFGRANRNALAGPKESATRLVDHERLTRLLCDAGLHAIDSDDVAAEGDQFQHPLLRPGLSLGGLLVDTARRANPAVVVRQFVWLCAPGPKGRAPAPGDGAVLKRPFLTTVIRTQGRRLHTLVETLVSLSAQSNDDFETLVVAHKVDPPGLAAVRQVVEDMAESLRGKIRLLQVEEGGRTRPLNVGFERARGEYIAILDDDDIPMAHWVAEFSNLARNHRGRVLRTACVRQDMVNVEISGKRGLRATSELARPFSSSFDFLEHFLMNFSPPICLAFPREAYHDLGLRFDERLSTCEDWDFLLQAAALCGVADSPEITGIYRWHHENSKSVHSEKEWQKDHKLIQSKLEDTWIILPRGESSRIVELGEASRRLREVEGERDDCARWALAAESERDDVANRLRAAASERDDVANRLRAAESQRDEAVTIKSRLRRPMRRHVRRRIIMLRVRRALSFWSRRRRGRLRAKIGEYKGLLRQL